MSRLRLAIVGAGPAGIYAADILLKHERSFDVSIDLFERLPAPMDSSATGWRLITLGSKASSPHCAKYWIPGRFACLAT